MKLSPKQLLWGKSMPKFTFISEDLDLNGYLTGSKTTKEFTVDSLDDVVSEFDMFLRGSGYSFEGKLEIYPQDPQEDTFILTGADDSDLDLNLNLDLSYPSDHSINIK